MDIAVSLGVVFPLVCFMAVGKICRLTGILDADTSRKLNGFCFKVLLPCTMFNNVIKAGEAVNASTVRFLLVLMAHSLSWFLLLCLLMPLFIKEKPRRYSFIQAAFRSNSVLFALAVAERLFAGDGGAVGLISVCVSVLVPFYNVLCVLLFKGGKKDGEQRNGVLTLLKDIFTTPLVFSAICGMAVLLLDIKLPSLVSSVIGDLAVCANPLALVVLGADLELGTEKSGALQLLSVCAVKLVLLPLSALLLVRALGYADINTASAVIVTFAPAAVSSYSFAVTMGGDGPFSASAVAWTTVVSVVTVVLWVSVMQLMGLI